MRWAVLLCMLLVPAANREATDATGGKIVYSRQEGDRILLHVMNADGSGDTALPGQTARIALLPTWSPDGKRIGCMAIDPPRARLLVVNADGTEPREPQTPAPTAGLPAWSPDGKQLAFVSGNERPHVYLADADGSNPRQLDPEGAGGVFPFWLKDGKRVGYSRLKAGEEVAEIVLAKADGSGEEALTQNGKLSIAGANALSPDGRRLAFLVVDKPARAGSLRLLDLESKVETGLAELKLDYVGEFFLAPTPAWSPDGKGVLVPIATEKGRGLFLLSDDGKTRKRLTPEGVDSFQAAWRAG